jgi:hypothetical protein
VTPVASFCLTLSLKFRRLVLSFPRYGESEGCLLVHGFRGVVMVFWPPVLGQNIWWWECVRQEDAHLMVDRKQR